MSESIPSDNLNSLGVNDKKSSNDRQMKFTKALRGKNVTLTEERITEAVR